MSLLRANFPSTSEFGPLFRLLDDYDNHRSNTYSAIRSFAPKFDVRESETEYHLDGELPGIAQENVNVEFTDPQTLVVKGRTEREHHTTDLNDQEDKEQAVVTTDKGSKAKSGHRYWASERSVGEFSRAFSFPDRIDQDNVKASLKNGILSIVVPKAAAPPTKKITIE